MLHICRYFHMVICMILGTCFGETVSYAQAKLWGERTRSMRWPFHTSMCRQGFGSTDAIGPYRSDMEDRKVVDCAVQGCQYSEHV
jgi:hypothetical protein